jgi:hypothetical protein
MNVFDEIRENVTSRIREREDQRVLLLLELLSLGVSSEDAQIAIDLHMDIVDANPPITFRGQPTTRFITDHGSEH